MSRLDAIIDDAMRIPGTGAHRERAMILHAVTVAVEQAILRMDDVAISRQMPSSEFRELLKNELRVFLREGKPRPKPLVSKAKPKWGSGKGRPWEDMDDE